jgi:hypothetical protein
MCAKLSQYLYDPRIGLDGVLGELQFDAPSRECQQAPDWQAACLGARSGFRVRSSQHDKIPLWKK